MRHPDAFHLDAKAFHLMSKLTSIQSSTWLCVVDKSIFHLKNVDIVRLMRLSSGPQIFAYGQTVKSLLKYTPNNIYKRHKTFKSRNFGEINTGKPHKKTTIIRNDKEWKNMNKIHLVEEILILE